MFSLEGCGSYLSPFYSSSSLVLFAAERSKVQIPSKPRKTKFQTKSQLRSTLQVLLRPIYTVQLCRMRYAYDKSTTRIVSCKSNLQLACDCRVRHEECRGLLKHVLKPYDNRSDRQI